MFGVVPRAMRPLALFCLLLFSCTPTRVSYDYQQEQQRSRVYEIGVGDVLRVSVYLRDDLGAQVVVRPDGKVELPLVGEVMAEGLSVAALDEELSRRYTAFLQQPQVSISLVERRSYRVYVLGEVGKPGMLSPSEPLHVLQAIALAGGFSRFADKSRICVLRRREQREFCIPFVYPKVARGEAPEQNFLLRSGDTIIVP
jgi:polysaccharide export outer membrane protein